MKASDARKLIGKRVQWMSSYCAHRGTYRLAYGDLQDVKGRNALIDGDWKWIPNLTGLSLAPPPPVEE